MSQPLTPSAWSAGPIEPAAPRGEVHLWLTEITSGGPSSEAILRAVLARYLGEDPQAIRIEAAPSGKPRLAGRPERLRFNLSHSGALVLVGVASVEVGVDVQSVEPRRSHLAIAERRLGAEAAEAVRAAGEERRAEVFTEHWVRFEARHKCLGIGVFDQEPEGAAVAVAPLEVAPGYAAAFAVAAERVPPSRRFLLG
jgi:4'-phosphopantetheinyl transferase